MAAATALKAVSRHTMSLMSSRIIILGGISSSLINFRHALLREFVARGHEVVACAAEDADAAAVRATLGKDGIQFIPVPFERAGLNLFHDLRTLRALITLFGRLRPDRVLAYTAKPVIYGGIAARRAGNVPFFPMITGVGYAFTEGRGLRRRALKALVQLLYRNALQSARCIFFQNPDDRALFDSLRLIPGTATIRRIFGSGVDLEYFPQQPLAQEPVFLMLARLLVDKGVREYVEAARRVRRLYPQARFQLAGGTDPSPASIRLQEIRQWQEEGVIEYLGPLYDIRATLSGCRYYVLPSYREGTPRSVLEAMATGRPIITTHAPGCRETVRQGCNGLLVPPRDAAALAEAMLILLQTPADRIEMMAEESRRLAHELYDVRKVNAEILGAMGL